MIAESSPRKAKPQLPAKDAARGHEDPSPVQGHFDGFGGVFVAGWAVDPADPAGAAWIEVLDENKVVAVGRAFLFRRDLLEHGLGNGRHAFRIILPTALYDDRDHSLGARLAGRKDLLPGGPLKVHLPRAMAGSGYMPFPPPAARDISKRAPVDLLSLLSGNGARSVGRKTGAKQERLSSFRTQTRASLSDPSAIEDEVWAADDIGLFAAMFDKLEASGLPPQVLQRAILVLAERVILLLARLTVSPPADLIERIPRLRQLIAADVDGGVFRQHGVLVEQLASAAEGRDLIDRDLPTYAANWFAGPKVAALKLLGIEALLSGVEVALPNFFRRITRGILGDGPHCLPALELGTALRDGGWFEQVGDAVLAGIPAGLHRKMVVFQAGDLSHLRLLLGFTEESSASHSRRIYATVLSCVLRWLFELRRLREADMVLRWCGQVYGARCASEAEFNAFVLTFQDVAIDAGRWLAEQAPVTPVTLPAQGKPITLGFLCRGSDIGAGAMAPILQIVRGLLRQKVPTVQPAIYLIDACDSEAEGTLDEIGCPVIFLHRSGIEPGDMVRRYMDLRDRLVADKVHVACWASALDTPFWLYGCRLAPVQIYFSCFMHPHLREDVFDGLITFGSPALVEQKFLDKAWRVVPAISEGPVGDVELDDVDLIRKDLAGRRPKTVIIGTLTPPDRLSRDYLATVAMILKRRKEALFVWTGPVEEENVTRTFAEYKVLERTHFAGLVDNHLYAKVFDLMLVGFSGPDDAEVAEAMRTGTALVSLSASGSSLSRDLAPLISELVLSEDSEVEDLKVKMRDLFNPVGGGVPLPIAATTADYENIADRLIGDAALRQSVGEALFRAGELLHDHGFLTPRAFRAHVLALVDSRRADNASESPCPTKGTP